MSVGMSKCRWSKLSPVNLSVPIDKRRDVLVCLNELKDLSAELQEGWTECTLMLEYMKLVCRRVCARVFGKLARPWAVRSCFHFVCYQCNSSWTQSGDGKSTWYNLNLLVWWPHVLGWEGLTPTVEHIFSTSRNHSLWCWLTFSLTAFSTSITEPIFDTALIMSWASAWRLFVNAWIYLRHAFVMTKANRNSLVVFRLEASRTESEVHFCRPCSVMVSKQGGDF